MEPFPFERLPLELKIKIIHEALPRLIVPENFNTSDKPYSQAEQYWVGNLQRSCKEIQYIVNNIRKIVAFDHGKVLFRLDPILDTLLVKNMCLPSIGSTKDWNPATSDLDRRALPIRRLMTRSRGISVPKPHTHFPNGTSCCVITSNPLTVSKDSTFPQAFTACGQKSLSLLLYMYCMIYHLSKSW